MRAASTGAVAAPPREEAAQRLPRLTWVGVVYAVIMLAAVVTRLWDLGGRALHYDEILHAWYSWRFAEGLGYSHTPVTHGPFLFHANALIYTVFGSSDVTARILPALFGIALVGMPWFLRKELGRAGAIAMSVLLLVSLNILYFSRFIRDDVYMAVYMLAAVIVIMRYREAPKTWMLLAWTVIWVLAFATLESAHIFAGVFGLALLVWDAPAWWAWARGRLPLSQLPPLAVLLLLLVTLTLPLWAPAVGLFRGLFDIILVNPDANDPRVMSGELFRANAETGAPVGGAMYVAAFIVVLFAAIAIAMGLMWNRRLWPLLAGTFVIIWLTLYTSVFTNWKGFFTGLWGSLGYWIAQHGVERANQPVYYYVLSLGTYEFFILSAFIGGAIYIVARRTPARLFFLYWALAAFAVFSWAGERMPWIVMHIVLPMAAVAGLGIGALVEGFRRASVPGVAARGIAAAGLAALLVLTGIVAQRAAFAYDSFERPNELLVYSQTGQHTKYATECIETLADRSGRGRDGLRVFVGEDDNNAWQWRWYLRNYRNVEYRFVGSQPQAVPPNADVLLIASSLRANIAPQLGGFTKIGDYHQLWWFPNYVYTGLTPSRVLKNITTKEAWLGPANYVWSREVGTPMYRSDAEMYVSNDLAPLVTGCLADRATRTS